VNQDLVRQVWQRAHSRCEYCCLLPFTLYHFTSITSLHVNMAVPLPLRISLWLAFTATGTKVRILRDKIRLQGKSFGCSIHGRTDGVSISSG